MPILKHVPMQTLVRLKRDVHAPAYLPIHLDALRIDRILNFDLFIYLNKEMILYRSKSLAFTDRTKANLLENNIKMLYISYQSKEEYQKYIESSLPDILSDPELAEISKASILYDASKTLVKEVLENPTFSENIRRSEDLVENTVNYVLKGRQAFLNLMKLTSFDYYTYTHSVNVCTFAVALARQVDIQDKQTLVQLGTGALLHDVGKSKVSERILNKRTVLNRAEFEIMKKHPSWGVEILQETNIIPNEAYFSVQQHHERFDGSGYPDGLIEQDIHLFGRIVAVCDVFDALTTQRAYQNAIDTYPALKIMHGMKNALDPQLLREFTAMMGPDCDKNIY